MPDAAAETVLERKVAAQRRALGAGSVSVPRALGRSLSLAADSLWALGLHVTAREETALTAARALATLSGDQLLVVLDREDGPPALMAFDRALVTGVTEVQTLGRVTRLALEERPYTATDAAMLAPLIDAALPRFSSMLTGQPERAHLQGYRFGALVEDVQAAGLALDRDRYAVLRFEVSLGQELRTGAVIAILPDADPRQSEEGEANRTGKYETAMKLVPARLQAVLTRIHIPLERAQALKPGDILEISQDALSSATLVVDGGHVAARGRMGQINGFRAIRIGTDAPLSQQSDTAPRDMAKGAPVPVGPPAPVSVPALQTVRLDEVGMDLSLDSLAAGVSDPADPS